MPLKRYFKVVIPIEENLLPSLNYSRMRDIIITTLFQEAKSMAVQYNKLFKLLIDMKTSNAELAEKVGVSANIITRLKRNQYISLDTVEKICIGLHCGVDDILEFTNSEK